MKWKKRRRFGWVGEIWLICDVFVVVDVVVGNALGWCCSCCCLSAAAKGKAEEEYEWAENEDECEEEEDETGLVMMMVALLF